VVYYSLFKPLNRSYAGGLPALMGWAFLFAGEDIGLIAWGGGGMYGRVG